MAIKPILFNTEMVQAILDGRKSCTRRVIKPQPQSGLCYTYGGGHKDCIGKWTYPNRGAHKLWGEEYKLPENIKDEELSKRWNPPYKTGDIPYVRETWCALPVNEAGHMRGHCVYYYRADGDLRPEGWRGKWHPSIHMPKEAARIWLKVTNVRVERLRDITLEQIGREGVEVEYPHVLNGEEKRYAFSTLWNSTIKKSDLDSYGWNANPWVWVIEFERCEKPEE